MTLRGLLLYLWPVVLPAQPAAYTNGIGMEFVLIPAGKFVMGRFMPTCRKDSPNMSPANYRKCLEMTARESSPGFLVKISRPFYLGKYEVTQEQWRRVMGRNPSHFQGAGSERQPVESVSWQDVQVFLQKLNAREKTTRYRLPTEAEWEYAARAGSTDDRPPGAPESYAWGARNDALPPPLQPHAVGQKSPNPWGLYDMLGNVWEWCSDRYAPELLPQPGVDPKGPASGTEHVLRGGSFESSPPNLAFGVHAGGPGVPLATGFRALAEVN